MMLSPDEGSAAAGGGGGGEGARPHMAWLSFSWEAGTGLRIQLMSCRIVTQ